MRLMTKECRCCGARAFARCGARPVSGFFATYGLHLTGQGQISIEHGACTSCSFVAPWPELSNDSLSDFYSFYLSEAYKVERSRFEPSYGPIGARHGTPKDLATRAEGYRNYIRPHLARHRTLGMLTVLDYGGGDGQVAPVEDWAQVDILEVQDAVPRSRNEGATASAPYDFVQLLHVLEHVGHPSATLAKALTYLRPGGLVYVEVPREMTDFARMANQTAHVCDEHINKFCGRSIKGLAAALNLAVIECLEDVIAVPHLPSGSTEVVRLLAAK